MGGAESGGGGAEGGGCGAKCAVVAIIGRPSVGKSAFLNAAAGRMVSIVSAVPQTTRNAVRGIVTGARGQLVFIDTPGYHQSEKLINRRMKTAAERALRGADAVLYMLDATRPPGPEEEAAAALLSPFQDKLAAAVNKTDLPGGARGELTLFLASRLPAVPAARIVSIAARPASGEPLIAPALDALFALAPDGPPLYPPDIYTDQPPAFRAAEIIRGAAIGRLRAEIPHALYAETADIEERGARLFIRAFLCVETESQKGIVIGKSGSLIKAIRLDAERELRRVFERPAGLDLRVKVRKNWKTNAAVLDALSIGAY